MSAPIRQESTAGYDDFAKRVVATGILTDPWIDGAPRLREAPLVLDAETECALRHAAESVAAVYDELCRIVEGAPELLDDFFGLTPWQKAMWLSSQPMWHGIARADVFVTDEGLAIAELNCDTPTGEAEAVVLGALARGAPGAGELVDPNRGLGARFLSMLEVLAAREVGRRGPYTVGLVYPTEITEDLSLVRLYRRWLEERGHAVVLGSPYNLTAKGAGEGVALFDTPIDVMLRHYKTDWWSERASAWDDGRIDDMEPLFGPLHAALEAAAEGKLAVVNPFGAVLPQNKRAMALMWEHIHRFSPEAQSVIQRHVPVTSRLETLHVAELLAQRDEWVLKSDYGAEGDEVILGRAVTEDVWRASLEHARAGRWIAQRYFDAATNEDGESVNYGVYLVAGRAAGLYARAQRGATDVHAVSVPVLVRAS